MYKKIIETHLLQYLKLKKIPYRKSGKVIMVSCPFCNQDKMVANIIPNTNIINCFVCKKKYTIIDIAKQIEEKFPGAEEEQYHFLKELLKVKVMTKTDEHNIEKVLDFYVENGFDLVPIANNAKIPVEKDWTNKSHKEKDEWQNWIVNGLNIGVKTGSKSNVIIIDIDQKPIPEEVRELMGNTLIQESTNGFHLFYKYDKDFPKTRIDSFKIDIENDGGQVVIYPSKIKGIERKLQLHPIIEMPIELKKLLLSKITVPRKTNSEIIREDIKTEDFKIDPKKFLLKNNNLEGSCNTEFIKLGGILRKQLTTNQTGYVLNVLNKHMLEKPMQQQAIRAMIRELSKYNTFDEKELAHKVLEHLKETGEMNRTEMAMTIVGTNRGEEKKRVDKVLEYLVREEYLCKRGTKYSIIKQLDWSEELLQIGVPVKFKVPYFHSWAYFNQQDIIIIGSQNKYGKTTLSMNFVQKLVKQRIKPDYIYNETGGRFAKVALKLGMKAGDFASAWVSSPSKVILREGKVTVFDWVKPDDFARTDNVFAELIEKVKKTNGFLICFVQLRNDDNFFAKDQIGQFPALLAKYVYNNEEGTDTQFLVENVRESKIRRKKFSIPCIYDWETHLVKTVEEIEQEKIKENETPKKD